MFTEILPNLASTIIVFFPLASPTRSCSRPDLSFLGAGVQPPTPSWGEMISDGIDLIPTAPHLTIVPGLMLVADRPGAQRLRRRRARRARPAGEGPDRTTDGPLHRPAADRDDRGAVRDLGAHVPDLQRDPERRSRAPAGRPQRRPPPRSRRSATSGASTSRSTSSTCRRWRRSSPAPHLVLHADSTSTPDLARLWPTLSLAIGAGSSGCSSRSARHVLSAEGRASSPTAS